MTTTGTAHATLTGGILAGTVTILITPAYIMIMITGAGRFTPAGHSEGPGWIIALPSRRSRPGSPSAGAAWPEPGSLPGQRGDLKIPVSPEPFPGEPSGTPGISEAAA